MVLRVLSEIWRMEANQRRVFEQALAFRHPASSGWSTPIFVELPPGELGQRGVCLQMMSYGCHAPDHFT